jgi:hypothetical protein
MFVKSITCSQHLGWVFLADEEVYQVEEPTNSIGLFRSDRNEGDGYTASNPNRELNVQVL